LQRQRLLEVCANARLPAADAAANDPTDDERSEEDRVHLLAQRHRIKLIDETLKHGRLLIVLLILRKC
jgi:hypothetical protein